MALQGYLASIKGQSSAIALTDEATTGTGNISYQITNVSKRILDLNTAVIVKVGGAVVTTGFKISYLTGTITFDSSAVRVVTVSGSYVVLSELVQGRSYSFSGTRDMIDITTFKKSFKEYQAGLVAGTASIGVLYADTFYYNWLMDKSAKVIEFYVADAVEPIRFYALMSDDSINIPVEGIVDQSLTLQITKELSLYA